MSVASARAKAVEAAVDGIRRIERDQGVSRPALEAIKAVLIHLGGHRRHRGR